MADYRQPVKNEVEKNIQTDFNEGWTLVRTITAVEAHVWTPGYFYKNYLAQSFMANCRKIALRVFSDTAAAAPVLLIAAESHPGPALATDKTFVPWSMAETAFRGTVTTSGRTCDNVNPITNVATPGVRWSSTSLFTAAAFGHPSNICTTIPTIDTVSFETLFLLDCFGRNLFFPYATSMSTASNILVAMKRIE